MLIYSLILLVEEFHNPNSLAIWRQADAASPEVML